MNFLPSVSSHVDWEAGKGGGGGEQPEQWFLSGYQKSLEGFQDTESWPPNPVSDSVGPGKDLTICISNRYPGDVDTAVLGTTLSEPQVWRKNLMWLPKCQGASCKHTLT